MALVGLHLEATREYQSVSDPARGKDDATVFILGTLPSRLDGKIRDDSYEWVQAGDGAVAHVKSRDAKAKRVKYGLKGWRNFRGTDGNEIKFETQEEHFGGRTIQVVAPQCMDVIPLEIMSELADEIVKVNTLGTDDAKISVE